MKTVQTLVQIAADLRNGKDDNITRLTMLKSLCSDPEAATEFAVHLVEDIAEFWGRDFLGRGWRKRLVK